jgi:oligosaccharide repeat unit polymerase
VAWNTSPQAFVATAAAALAISCAILAIRIEYRERGIHSINAVSFLWAGILYFVGIAGLIAAHVTRRTDAYSVRINVIGLLVVFIGVLGVALGTKSVAGERLGRTVPEIMHLDRRSLYVLASGLLLLAMISRFAAFGTAFLFGSLDRSQSTWGNYVYDLRHAMLPAALLFVALALTATSRQERLLLSCLLLIATAFSFLQFSRRPLALLAIGSFVLWIHNRSGMRGSKGRVWVVLGVLAGVVLSIAVLGAAFRFVVLQASGVPVGFREIGLVLTRFTPSFVSLDAYDVMLSCVRWYREPTDWLVGGSFVQVITNPIPRGLWLGKPESFGFSIAQLMGEYRTNFGPTAFGEGFANLGLLGSFVFGWLLGFASRLVSSYQRHSSTNTAAVLTAMISFEFFPQVRGDLQGMTTPMLERTALLVVGVWLVSRLLRGNGIRSQPEHPLDEQYSTR